MELFAPGRLSATTVWPIRSLSPWVTLRAVISEEPPGAKGTMMVMGFCLGHSLAAAGDAAIMPARQVAATASDLRVKNALLFIYVFSGRSWLCKARASVFRCLSI